MQVGSGSLGRPPHPRLQGLSRSSHSLNVSVGLCWFCVCLTRSHNTSERKLQPHTQQSKPVSGPLFYWWTCRDSNSGVTVLRLTFYVRSLWQRILHVCKVHTCIHDGILSVCHVCGEFLFPILDFACWSQFYGSHDKALCICLILHLF